MAETHREYSSAIPSDDSVSGPPWLSPKSLIALQPTQTAVWRIDLSPTDLVATTLLSPEERARADRFRHAAARAHFVAGRTALRLLLAKQLGTDPTGIHLGTGPQGKPYLLHSRDLAFNLAHSGGVVLVALTHSDRLGVDLEEITPNPDLAEIAERMFAPEEQASLRAEPDAQRRDFFRLWARKEAVLKADGRGLSLGTASFSVLGDTVVADGQIFYLSDLPVGPTHAAALATSMPARNLHLYRFPSALLPHA